MHKRQFMFVPVGVQTPYPTPRDDKCTYLLVFNVVLFWNLNGFLVFLEFSGLPLC